MHRCPPVIASLLVRGTVSYCESFNGKLRDEWLNGEIFYSLKEAQVVIEKWRVNYNCVPYCLTSLCA